MNTFIENQNVNEFRPYGAYFATEPRNNVSNKYNFISTNEVVQYFRNNGFYITHYSEAGIRNEKNRGKTTHMIRLRKIVDKDKLDAPEVVIINSHNKYKALKVLIGAFRFACANGLILGDTFFSGSIKHIGLDMYKQLDDLLVAVKAKFTQVDTVLGRLKSTELTPNEKYQFAKRVVAIRTKNSKQYTYTNTQDLLDNLKVLRTADFGDDVYTIMNILQEKALDGGLKYRYNKTVDNVTEITTKTTRNVKSINEIARLNTEIFDAALELVA